MKPRPSDRFGDNSRYSTKGVRVRAVRLAICEELNVNASLRTRIIDAVSLLLPSVFWVAEMTGHGGNLRMSGALGNGKLAVVMIDVQFAAPISEGAYDAVVDYPAVARRDSSVNRVTIAPAEWFTHSGNASYSVNSITFEDLLPIVGDDLKVLLSDGIDRVATTFRYDSRPRVDWPIWLKMRRRA